MIEYLVLVASLGAGLIVYERWGWRLGGVMVLPLIVAYAMFAPRVLPAFLFAALVTYVIGEAVQRRTLLYGRRLLYVYIVVGLVAAAVLLEAFRVPVDGVALAILPGIFAFNLHREGAPVRSLAQFVPLAVGGLVVAHLVLHPLGYRGGLFDEFPVLLGLADALPLQSFSQLSPIGSVSAAPGILDEAGVGALLASLVGGETE